jgi:putative radical SAM enzyme (TIGR03279 family)
VTGLSPAADGLVVAGAEGAAARAGLRAGDCIVRLNGRLPADVLDLETAAADGPLWLTVLRNGRALDVTVVARRGESHGVSLTHELGVPSRTCRNRCRFCFVDQVPAGLRESLYVRDDDYRLSFLHGAFTTLSNVGDEELERIVALRLSPLYVSLHAWDDAARVALMGAAARATRCRVRRLSAAGIELHLQVVLCPDWNDGDVLEETVRETARLAAVADVGVVPVSLAEEGDLRRVRPGDAVAVLATLARWRRELRRRRGRAFVHASDELHLLAGRTPPPSDAPLQYQNGVGMTAAFTREARTPFAGEGRPARGRPLPPVRLLSGVLARPIAERAVELLAAHGVQATVLSVENELFGAHVTVTGLLGGREVLRALRRAPLAPTEWLLAPRDWLPRGLGATLDDVAADEIAAACGGRLALADGLRQAFARLTR